MSDPYASIPGPVTPGMVYPTPEGRWVFSIVAAGQEMMAPVIAPFYSAGMAKGAMRDLVAKLAQRKPKLGVVS